MAKRNAGWGVAGKARQPKASVIIPTFMEEKYLGSTLDSIMAQRPGFGFEVIVSDAKSTDGTAKIARQRGARVVLCPKTTIAEGRVVGASAANGEILVFATADNYYYPDWLSDMIRPFSDKKISGVIGKVRMKEKSLTEKIFCEYIIYPIGVGFSKIGLYFANGESLAVRKSVYYRIGGIKKMLETSDDTDLAKRASGLGKVVFSKQFVAETSRRRLEKWGALKFLSYHTINFFMCNLFGKPLGDYEPIR